LADEALDEADVVFDEAEDDFAVPDEVLEEPETALGELVDG